MQQISKRVSLGPIDGGFFDEFKAMLDDLYIRVASKEFDNLVKHEIDTSNIICSKCIDRFNVNMWINRLENAHKVAYTDNSKKWLKYLKRYSKQFGVSS